MGMKMGGSINTEIEKMEMGMQCRNGNGWEWFDGSGKRMRTRKSFPHTS